MKLFWNRYTISDSVISLEEFIEQGETTGILDRGELNPPMHLVFLYNITIILPKFQTTS